MYVLYRAGCFGKFCLVWSSGCFFLTRVGHILKKLHEGHLGVFFDPQEEIVITFEILRIFQPNFTGISQIWSGIWKCVKKKISKMAANMAAEILNRMYLSSPSRYKDK